MLHLCQQDDSSNQRSQNDSSSNQVNCQGNNCHKGILFCYLLFGNMCVIINSGVAPEHRNNTAVTLRMNNIKSRFARDVQMEQQRAPRWNPVNFVKDIYNSANFAGLGGKNRFHYHHPELKEQGAILLPNYKIIQHLHHPELLAYGAQSLNALKDTKKVAKAQDAKMVAKAQSVNRMSIKAPAPIQQQQWQPNPIYQSSGNSQPEDKDPTRAMVKSFAGQNQKFPPQTELKDYESYQESRSENRRPYVDPGLQPKLTKKFQQLYAIGLTKVKKQSNASSNQSSAAKTVVPEPKIDITQIKMPPYMAYKGKFQKLKTQTFMPLDELEDEDIEDMHKSRRRHKKKSANKDVPKLKPNLQNYAKPKIQQVSKIKDQQVSRIKDQQVSRIKDQQVSRIKDQQVSRIKDNVAQRKFKQKSAHERQINKSPIRRKQVKNQPTARPVKQTVKPTVKPTVKNKIKSKEPLKDDISIAGVETLVYVLRNQNARIPCNVKIAPGETAAVTWRHLHGEPMTDSRFTITKSGVLQIVGAQPRDSDIYICKVEQTGKEHKHVLRVYSPPEVGYEVKWKYKANSCDAKKIPEIKSAVHAKLKESVCSYDTCRVMDVRLDCKLLEDKAMMTISIYLTGIFTNDAKCKNMDCMQKIFQKQVEDALVRLKRFLEKDLYLENNHLRYIRGTLRQIERVACPAGYGRKGDRCAPCDPGHFSEASSSVCMQCDRGYYQPELGASSCLRCPREDSPSGSDKEDDCNTVIETQFRINHIAFVLPFIVGILFGTAILFIIFRILSKKLYTTRLEI